MTRFEEAKSRLSRIQLSNWDLEVKVHVIIASVFAVAFYGAEMVPIGVSHLNTQRLCIANAILGSKNRSSSPALLLNFVHHRLVDPNLFVILQAVQKARKFLMKRNAVTRDEFLKKSCNASHHNWNSARTCRYLKGIPFETRFAV